MTSPHALALAAALALLAAPATTAAFTLAPISRVFDASGAGATQAFELKNPGRDRIAVEVTIETLGRDEDYVERNRPADDQFLIMPAQVLLAPGGRQTVRITWIGDPRPASELAFRIVATELPVDFSRAAGAPAAASGAVKIVTTYRGTMFVRPRGARPEIVAATAGPDPSGRELLLVMRNQGGAHGRLDGCRVDLRTASGQTATLRGPRLGMDDLRVLARSRRRFHIPWPAGLPVGSVQATVRCTTS